MVEVGAALIWQGDTFMICQRPAHKARGLLWEFVGGKVEPGETRQQALVRECREELGLAPDMSRGGLIMGYCGKRVYHDVWLFRQEIAREDMRLQPGEVDDAAWFTPEEIRAMLRRGEVTPLGYVEQLLMMLPVLCAC